MSNHKITCAAAIVLATACPAMAAPAENGLPAETKMTFMEIFFSGGPMMYPLALLSIVGVVLVLIYLLTIRRNAVVSDRFMNTAEQMIHKRDFMGLLSYCARRNECMARVTQKSLDFLTKYPDASFAGVREVAESEGSRQAGLLGARITYLADIGSIAPMVGLLGTVIGMIKSFLQISSGGFEGARQMQLAEGVSEALITTAAGLVIGIPALVFYSIFRGRVQKYIAELEAASTHLMALLQSQMPGRAPTSPPGSQQQAVPRRVQEAALQPREDFAMPVHRHDDLRGV